MTKREIRMWMKRLREELREVERALKANEPVGEAAMETAGVAGELENVCEQYDTEQQLST